MEEKNDTLALKDNGKRTNIFSGKPTGGIKSANFKAPRGTRTKADAMSDCSVRISVIRV